MPQHVRSRGWRLQPYALTAGTHGVDDAFANADLLPQKSAMAERTLRAAEKAVDEFRPEDEYRMTPARWWAPIILGALILAACSGDADSTVSGSSPTPSEPAADESVVLMVSGTVSSDPPSVDFAPTRLLPTTKQLDGEPGPWTLTLETDDGSIDVPFDVIDQLDGDEPAARFSVPVQPAPIGPIGRIAVAFQGDEVGAVDGGDAVPSIRITEPIPGATVGIDEFEIAWESDVGTSAAAYLSVDGGTSWTSIVTQAESSPIRPAPGIAVPSDEALVLLTVSDGVNAAFARVGPLTLTASS